jgi:hypothetical protein
MKVPEQYRLIDKESGNNNNGTFLIPSARGKVILVVVRENSLLEKIKVTVGGTKPTMPELFRIVYLFWGDEEGEYTIFYHGSIAGVYRSKVSTRKEPFLDADHNLMNVMEGNDFGN